MAYHGTRAAGVSTNPISIAVPGGARGPVVLDMATGVVARGKLVQARKTNQTIPAGWALDRDGNPTTDARAALTGSMLALGGTKGAMLALIVELLACALTGAAFGFEADTFFVDDGNQPNLGQAFLTIDPDALAGRDVYRARIETLISEMMKDPGVRLPGSRRRELAARHQVTGITVPEALAAELERLAR